MNAFKTLAAAATLGISLTLSLPLLAAGPVAGVISFDHGSLDTLDALGLSDQVVAVPKQGLPDYLARYADGDYPDVGGLKTPDLDQLRKLQPGLILVTGRQAGQQEALQAIAEVRNVGLTASSYREGVNTRVQELAELFGAQQRAVRALTELWAHVEQQREAIAGEPLVLVVTHNNGNYGLRQEPVVTELLALAAPALPAGVVSVTRGTRVFTPLTVADIAAMAPDLVLVVDRSAAIGDLPLDKSALESALADQGATATAVTVLSPGLWYLSGGGLESIRLQVDEVVAALP